VSDGEPSTIAAYHELARSRLPAEVYGFIAGGAGEEWTLAENERAFDDWVIRPRHLRGSGSPDPATEVLGVPIAFPVLVAPWAFQTSVHPDGEVGTARGAAAAGTIAVISTRTTRAPEEVAAASEGPKWWQLYLFGDRGASAAMLERVVLAGYAAICMTVDFPVIGIRARDLGSGWEPPRTEFGGFEQDPELDWDDVGWVRERCAGVPLLLKGILTAEDAELAVAAGVDGIVVSNHGGRQLDRVPSGIAALPEIVAAVAGRVPILVDGGVRRGTDVLIALALGARAVLVGRPAAWGLAVGGADGVARVLGIYREGFENAMALSGCRRVDEIGPAMVAGAPASRAGDAGRVV
jgi:isopentenyl diphosphate isomerase/L-lactate dehydrogenase-like FMN-dependent dehydrogenase